MTYKIENNTDDMKLNYYSVDINGLNVTPSGTKADSMKITKITIADKELSNNYAKHRINKKIDKIIELMLKILENEGTSDEDAGMVLDEISRLKGIIYNKYKEHMKVEEYKALLSKLIILEEQFKKDYNQKIFLSHMANAIMSQNQEERTEGRSR